MIIRDPSDPKRPLKRDADGARQAGGTATPTEAIQLIARAVEAGAHLPWSTRASWWTTVAATGSEPDARRFAGDLKSAGFALVVSLKSPRLIVSVPEARSLGQVFSVGVAAAAAIVLDETPTTFAHRLRTAAAGSSGWVSPMLAIFHALGAPVPIPPHNDDPWEILAANARILGVPLNDALAHIDLNDPE